MLLELEQIGRRDGIPIVSTSTGRLLSTLVHAMQANRILEIGTAYGYSTLWMALALPPAGRIWTIDPDRERTAIALDFLGRAGKADAVEVINQPALDVLPTFPQRNLDIVFIDALKGEYEAYLESCGPAAEAVRTRRRRQPAVEWPRRRRGTRRPTTRDTVAIRAFNRAFLHHPLLDATILPLGDGTGIGARIS